MRNLTLTLAALTLFGGCRTDCPEPDDQSEALLNEIADLEEQVQELEDLLEDTPVIEENVEYVSGVRGMIYRLEDGVRYTIPWRDDGTYGLTDYERAVFYSWEESVSIVRLASNEELATYTLAGNMQVKPGTLLLKINTDAKLYWIEENPEDWHAPILRTVEQTIVEEEIGSDWENYVLTVPDSFFVDYSIGSPVENIDVGTLVPLDDLDEPVL